MSPQRMRCTAVVFLASFLSLVLSPATGTAQVRDRGEDFSVMTWNLEWFFDNESQDNFSKLAKKMSAPGRPQWDWRRDQVAASIHRARPSIVALQEVENRRVLWYLARAIERNHDADYRETFLEGTDRFTEQDVGLLSASNVDLVQIARRRQTRAMRESREFYNLSKHALAVFEVPVGDQRRRIHVLNLHLRAKAEAAEIRMRQCRLAHRWVADLIRAGEHVLVLGDLNTEERAGKVNAGSDLDILCGAETQTTDDDLVDLHQFVPPTRRGTHLIPGRQFDRILASRNLVEDSPDVVDLSLAKIDVLCELNLRGPRDTQSEHWDGYWDIPAAKRDLSDHCPVMATFTVK